jgi:hypothetical protein
VRATQTLEEDGTVRMLPLIFPQPLSTDFDGELEKLSVRFLCGARNYCFRMGEQRFEQVEKHKGFEFTRRKYAKQQLARVCGLQKLAQFRKSERGQDTFNFSALLARESAVAD